MDIEEAKREVIRLREQNWKEVNNRKPYFKRENERNMPNQDNGFVEFEGPRGYFIMDTAAFSKLSKAKQKLAMKIANK